MIAPRVQIYVQPTPYTIGEMMPGSYVTMTTRVGHTLMSYRAGESIRATVPDHVWPINVNVNLPGFDQFNCKLERYQGMNVVNTGGDYRDTIRLPR